MNVIIHPVHFDASAQLVDFISKKFSKLETFFDRIVDAEVFLKLDSNQSVKDKIVEAKIHVPGKILFASEISKTFEESTDLVVANITRQLKKQKEKIQESHKVQTTPISEEANTPVDDEGLAFEN